MVKVGCGSKVTTTFWVVSTVIDGGKVITWVIETNK